MKTAASIVAIATMALTTPAWAKHHDQDAVEEPSPTAEDARAFVEET